jgi:hypothetical protein
LAQTAYDVVSNWNIHDELAVYCGRLNQTTKYTELIFRVYFSTRNKSILYLCVNIIHEQINHFLLFGTRIINISSARQKNPARVPITENLYLPPVCEERWWHMDIPSGSEWRSNVKTWITFLTLLDVVSFNQTLG